MTSFFAEQYGLNATLELVGRQSLLEHFESIVRNPSKSPKLVFLYGLGGIGKTRLLKEILESARTVSDCRVADEVLDFYHIMLHTPIGLTNAVFEMLSSPFDCFNAYKATYDTLNRALLGGNVTELENLRDDTLNTFDKDLKRLSVKNRVVLALDTVERIVYGLAGWTDEIPLAESWKWFVQRLGDWQNVIVFVAGREEARPAIEQIKAKHPSLIEEIEIGPFSEEESLEYFSKKACELKEEGSNQLGMRLENLPDDIKRNAHTYSQGRPILLALLVDYLSFPGVNGIPDVLRQAPHQLSPEESTRRFEEALFARLKEGEMGETLIALGRVPKGADEEMLSKLLAKDGRPLSIQEASKRLKEVQNFSVVKIRPHDQRVFLHDEMYAFLQRYVFNSPYDADLQNATFEAIKTHYQELCQRIIQELNKRYAPLEEKGNQINDKDKEKLNEVHTQYQSLLVEIMYYHLRYDLDRGFRTYYRYSHEATLARNELMDLQLQAELLSYLSRPPTPIVEKDIPVNLIVESLKIKPISRAWAFSKHTEGLAKGHYLIDEVESEWRSHFPPLLAALHVWTASLHIMRGRKEEDDFVEAEKHLAEVYFLLPEKQIARPFGDLVYPDTLLWYEKAVSALAHRVHGYLKRVQGLLKNVVAEYQKAIELLREVNLLIEMATVSNDMGFAQAELGEWHDGRANVEDALILRRELGQRVPVALSLNTLASIDVREGQDYSSAREKSQQALTIFRSFSHKRGIGMALVTLAEATRRQAGLTALLGVEERISLLREARDYAREAITCFQEVEEIPRQVDALIEVGCACRDWAFWLQDFPRPGDNIEKISKESRDALKQAVNLAAGTGYLLHRQLDALVNLAWLDYYKLKSDETITENHPIHTLIAEIEETFPNDDEMLKQPQVWAQKGKLFVLKGHLAYRHLKQQRQREPKGISLAVNEILREIATNYALGLDYSQRFTDDSQGIRQAKKGISQRLKDLNAAELQIICDRIKELYPSKAPLIQRFLNNRGLWRGG